MPISATGNKRQQGFRSVWRSAEHVFRSVWRSAEHGFRSVWRSAEHGFRSVWRSAEHGFTLVELMVVIAIIGLVTAGVVIAIPDPRGRLTDEAEKFAARTLAARDLAIVEGRPVAVRVTARGYAFDRRQSGAWTPLADKPFRSQPWSDGTSALVGQGGTVRTAFDATGQPSAPAIITLIRSGEQVRVTIGADGGIRAGG